MQTLRERFSGLGERIYLNTAAMGVGCDASVEALRSASDAWGRGALDYTAAESAGEVCRRHFATLIGVEPDTVALIPTASAVAGQVAAHMAGSVRPGTVLVGEQEYTSALFAWRMLEHKGFEVRTIPHRDGGPQCEDFARVADERTRLIATSAVQASTGWRADIAALRSIANASDALLYVDAAQMVGALAFDAQALGIDALAAPAHKFLLGTRGMGYAYFAPKLRDAMRPVAPGWKAAASPLTSFFGPEMNLSPTASRFDQSLAWINALGDVHGIGLLAEIGMIAVSAHNARLVDQLTIGLRAAGISFLDYAPGHRSTIVSIASERSDMPSRLVQAGIVSSVRMGRVRLGIHVYNTEAEIGRALDVLSS